MVAARTIEAKRRGEEEKGEKGDSRVVVSPFCLL